jgi:type IV secretory pathway VirB6-like protein
MSIISGILQDTSENLYNEIVGHPNYTSALAACVLLYVIIYGVMVVFDLANLKPGEIVTRLFKLGLVVWIASPGGWVLITDIVGKFFLGGMSELVNLFLLGAVQTSPWAGGGGGGVSFDPQALGAPLAILSGPVARLFGSKFGITIMGLLFLGGTGIFMALVMIWAGWNLMLALFNAVYVYVKSIVGLWFLLAISPIFIIASLFQMTRDLFQGWLNMVINFALQPVLLFAFFAFFLVMVSASLANIFAVEWCLCDRSWLWGLIDIQIWTPRSSTLGGWKFSCANEWLVTGATEDPRVQFPIQTLDVMFLLLSAYLGLQYANFVPQLTTQLSRNGLALGAGLEDTRAFFNARGWTPEQMGVQALRFGSVKLGTPLVGGAMAIASKLMSNRGKPPQA